MAFIHGKNTKVLANGYDLSAYFKSATVSGEAETAETTAFGQSSKAYIAGLKDATVSLEGMYDGAASAVDQLLNTALGNQTLSVLTIYPAGDTEGLPGYGFKCIETSYEVDSPLDDVVGISAEFQSSSGLERVLSLKSSVDSITADSNGGAVDGGAASTAGGVGYIHVPAFVTFTSNVVTIEDSADGSSGWATILTFTTVTAINAKERVDISGTVRRYTRAKWDVTGSGSTSIAVGFCRK